MNQTGWGAVLLCLPDAVYGYYCGEVGGVRALLKRSEGKTNK